MSYQDWLAHHGIKGMKWGKLNGPPYPLSDAQRSSTENRLNSTSASARALAKEGPNNRFVKANYTKSDNLRSTSKSSTNATRKYNTSGGGGSSESYDESDDEEKKETTSTSSSTTKGHTADYFKRDKRAEFEGDEEWQKAKASAASSAEEEKTEEEKKKAAEKAAKEAEKARKEREKAAEKARKEQEKAAEQARKQKEKEEKEKQKAEEAAKKAEEQAIKDWEKEGQKTVDDVFNDDINTHSFKDILDAFYNGAFDKKLYDNKELTDEEEQAQNPYGASEGEKFYANLLSKVDPNSTEYSKIKDVYDQIIRESADEKAAREVGFESEESDEASTATAMIRLSKSISALADYADYLETNSRTEVNRIHSKILGYLDDKLKWFTATASTNASGSVKEKQLQNYGEIEDWLKEHGF